MKSSSRYLVRFIGFVSSNYRYSTSQERGLFTEFPFLRCQAKRLPFDNIIAKSKKPCRQNQQKCAAVKVLTGACGFAGALRRSTPCIDYMFLLKEFNVAEDIFVGYSFVKALL
jgi:hypothetical protein